MTLGFQTKWGREMGVLAGQPNYFISKIWMKHPTAYHDKINHEHAYYWDKYVHDLGKPWDIPDIPVRPKIHSIRHDPSNRWKAGNKIHFVVNNRTKKRFQFAPIIECVNVQRVEITYIRSMLGRIPMVILDGMELVYDPSYQFADKDECDLIEALAINDGFDSAESFFRYFNEDFKGNLIHWTDFKY